MKANATPIDRAFERCRLLAGLIASEHKRARAYPTDDRYVELGLIERGAKIEKEKIRQAIDQKFDDLSALVEHVVILDMVAALELHFDGRIKTAVGEARRTLKGKFGDSALAGRNKLVRETDDFRGLQNIIDLVEPDISIEMQAILKISVTTETNLHTVQTYVIPRQY